MQKDTQATQGSWEASDKLHYVCSSVFWRQDKRAGASGIPNISRLVYKNNVSSLIPGEGVWGQPSFRAKNQLKITEILKELQSMEIKTNTKSDLVWSSLTSLSNFNPEYPSPVFTPLRSKGPISVVAPSIEVQPGPPLLQRMTGALAFDLLRVSLASTNQ